MNNIYDNRQFFDQYSKMSRSQQGLSGAGEWHQFKALFPELSYKSVLDLGCGYGWHCKYAVECGAKQVLGIDLSEKMIHEAKAKTQTRKLPIGFAGWRNMIIPPIHMIAWFLIWCFIILQILIRFSGKYT